MWHLITTYYIESIATFATVPAIITFMYRRVLKIHALRYFFTYLVVKLVIELIMFYMASQVMNNLYLGNILTVATFFLIARMFQEMYESKTSRKVVEWCEFAFIVVFSYDLVRDGMHYTFRYTGMFNCIFIMLFCLVYFYQLIQNPKIPNLLAYPFFWVCSGLLAYFACCTFISPLAFYLDRWPANRDMHIFVLIPYILESAYLIIISLGIMVGNKW